MPVFHNPFDSYWTAAFWVGATTLAVTGLLLIVLLVLKFVHRHQQQKDQHFNQAWFPLLVHASLDDAAPPALPPLRQGDDWRFIQLWVHFQSSLHGQANDRLRHLGLKVGCAQKAHQLLRSQHRSEQVFGILCLGYLRDPSAQETFKVLIEEDRNTLFIFAAWALLRIDPAFAVAPVVAQLLKRQDLDLAQTSSLLKPFRHLINPALSQALNNAPADQIAWLFKLGVAMGLQLDSHRLWAFLSPTQPMDTLIGALRLLMSSEGLDRVRGLADHPDWQVRTQVAITLGRIGEAQDLDLLLSLLMDPLWWVRYRAAQSLASWHFLERAHLSQRIAALPDRYAQDMAQQIFTQQESHPW